MILLQYVNTCICDRMELVVWCLTDVLECWWESDDWKNIFEDPQI